MFILLLIWLDFLVRGIEDFGVIVDLWFDFSCGVLDLFTEILFGDLGGCLGCKDVLEYWGGGGFAIDFGIFGVSFIIFFGRYINSSSSYSYLIGVFASILLATVLKTFPCDLFWGFLSLNTIV